MNSMPQTDSFQWKEGIGGYVETYKSRLTGCRTESYRGIQYFNPSTC